VTSRRLLSDVRSALRANGIGLSAAGVAYHLFNSLVASSLFVFIGLYGAGSLELIIDSYAVLTGLDVERASSTLESLIGDGVGRSRAVVIAGGILLWSSFKLIRAIDVAFGDIYGIRNDRSLRRTLLNGLVVFTTVVVAVPMISLVVVTLMVVMDAPSVRVLGVPLLFVVFLGVFMPTYYLFPDTRATLRGSLPGAAFAAITWTGCSVAFRLYVTSAESVRLYGAVGAVLLVLTWLYVGGVMLLVGAVVNAVLADRVEAGGDASAER